jgi:hypothetical protein
MTTGAEERVARSKFSNSYCSLCSDKIPKKKKIAKAHKLLRYLVPAGARSKMHPLRALP